MSECIYIQKHASWTEGQKRTLGLIGTGVMDSCEPSCGCWELNLGALNEHVLLISHLCRLSRRFSFLKEKCVRVACVSVFVTPELCNLIGELYSIWLF